jgi:hypothetical protein
LHFLINYLSIDLPVYSKIEMPKKTCQQVIFALFGGFDEQGITNCCEKSSKFAYKILNKFSNSVYQ